MGGHTFQKGLPAHVREPVLHLFQLLTVRP
jgi:hypothetical protein